MYDALVYRYNNCSPPVDIRFKISIFLFGVKFGAASVTADVLPSMKFASIGVKRPLPIEGDNTPEGKDGGTSSARLSNRSKFELTSLFSCFSLYFLSVLFFPDCSRLFH